MWELIQIISQLGIKDSYAVHTLTLALQAKFCRNRWNNGVWGFQLLLSKPKTPCDMESPRDSLWSLLPKVCWTTPMGFLGKLRLLLGRRQRTSASVNLCSRPPGYHSQQSLWSQELSAVCVASVPFSEPHRKHLWTSRWCMQSSISTTAPNSSHQETISTQETVSEMENKQPIKTKLD